MQLLEPLVTLQKHVAKLSAKFDSAAHMQLCLAAAARKNGRLPIAMIALHELRTTFRCSPKAPLTLIGHSAITNSLACDWYICVSVASFPISFIGTQQQKGPAELRLLIWECC